MTLLFLMVLALIPSLFWLFIFLRKDDYEPEPLRLILKIFALGAIVAVPVYFVQVLVSQYFFTAPETTGAAIWYFLLDAFLVAAAVEELAKYFAARTVVRRNKKFFTQATDGIIYMVVAAAGFVFAEDLLKFWQDYQASISLGFSSGFITRDLLDIFLVRFTGGALHLAASGIFGYFWGLAWFEGEEKGSRLLVKGFIGAALLHGLFNFSLYLTDLTGKEFGPVSIILAALGTAYVLFKFKHHELTEIHREPGTEATQGAPHTTTKLLKVGIPVLLVAAFFLLVPALNQQAGSTHYYSLIGVEDGEAAVVVQTESLQQCEIIKDYSIEFYGEIFDNVGGICDGSLDANEQLSFLFADERAQAPHLAYTDWRGHETRVIVLGDFTDEQVVAILQGWKEILEEAKGLSEIELVLP